MELNPYVQALRDEVAAAADTWGEEAREHVERPLGALEPAIRLSLLEALSAAAAEITRELAPGSVEVRLRGRDPEFVVSVPSTVPSEPEPAVADAPAWLPAEGDDATMSRINLRLPKDLKDRVEESARLAGLSVNAWLVRSAAGALTTNEPATSSRRGRRVGDRYTGWVR